MSFFVSFFVSFKVSAMGAGQDKLAEQAKVLLCHFGFAFLRLRIHATGTA